MNRGFLRALRSMSTTTSTGPMTTRITEKINGSLNPVKLEIFNDSHKHRHHAPMQGDAYTGESHFRLIIVSDAFQGKAQPARHRMIYSLLADELKQDKGIHALQLQTKTPAEWEKVQKIDGMNCSGQSH